MGSNQRGQVHLSIETKMLKPTPFLIRYTRRAHDLVNEKKRSFDIAK